MAAANNNNVHGVFGDIVIVRKKRRFISNGFGKNDKTKDNTKKKETSLRRGYLMNKATDLL